MKSARESNFELLRMLAMLGVMGLHAGLYGDVPPPAMGGESGVVTWARCVLHAFEVVSVNVFVLISGYFGIRLRLKGVLNFLWQIVFWRIVAVVALLLVWSTLPSTKSSYIPWVGLDAHSIGFSFGGWFIGAYMGLMLIAPILNAYADTRETKSLGKYVLGFFALEVVCDWLVPSLKCFGGGYTPFAFIGLYLAGRYLNREDAFDVSPRIAGALFVVLAVVAGSAMAVSMAWGGEFSILRNKLMYAAYGYTTPTTLVCSCALIVMFKHISLSSSVINWFAASAFGAYLFHGSLPFFKRTAVRIFEGYSGISCALMMIGFIASTYIIATLIDQIRRVVWNMGVKLCSK